MDARDDVLATLQERTDRFVATMRTMTPAQWTFRPSAHEWCAADVAEHVVLASRGVRLRLDALSAAGSDAPPPIADDEIPYLFYRADEPPTDAAPTGSMPDVDAAAKALTDSTRSLSVWARTTRLHLRHVVAPHPTHGNLDGLQWLMFASAHLERHRAQLLGLAAHPGFRAARAMA